MGLDKMNVPKPRDIAAQRVRSYWLLGAGLMVLYVALRGTGWQGNSPLHTLMEGAATILALVVGAMALVRYATKKNSAFLFVGTGFFGTAMLDGYHAVVTSTYFAQYLPSELSSLIPWSWVASRLFLSTMLCLSWFAWLREEQDGDVDWISERKVYVVGGVLTLASFLFFAFFPLPRAYYPEFIFHRPEEFLPAVLFAVALVGYWRKGLWRRDEFDHYIILSLIVGFISQAGIMSLSGGLFDVEFDVAHLLKAASYVVVLIGLFKSMSSVFRQAEDRAASLHGIVTTAHDGIISIDERGIVTAFNPAASHIFGYEEEDIIGKNVSTLMSGVNRDDHDVYLRTYLQTGQKKIIGIGREVEGRRKDGSLFPLDLSIGEMSISGHRAFTGIVRDITERKRAEELATKSTERLALTKSVAVDANEIEDIDVFVQSCLDHVCVFTGWPVGHVYRTTGMGRRLHSAKIWHLDDPVRFESFRKITESTDFDPGVGLPGRVIETGEPAWVVDVTLDPNFPRANMVEDIPVRGAFAMPVNVGGQCVMVLEFYSEGPERVDQELAAVLASTAEQIGRRIERERAAQDLRAARESSELAEKLAISASERAEAASLAKSEFLDNMSHELRTPLNGMIGFAEMIETETLGPIGNEQYGEYIKLISASGRHLLSIVNDVLDYSRIEAGRIELDESGFDIVKVVEDVVELLAPSAHEKGIELACCVAADVPANVTGDPSRLRQILLNLTGNAIKFTETGGVDLNVSLEIKRGKHVRLHFEVSDTGIGIDAAAQEKLFEKFSQADASTTRKYGGSGLGLAISKHLVTLMDGEIGVDSELGSGSAFWFTVGLGTSEGVDQDPLVMVAACMRGRHVLIVDDNEVNRLVSRRHFEMLGATVITEPGAREALIRLDEVGGKMPFDLTIIDHVMPNIDGVELGQLIREHADCGDLKMVLSSSSGHLVDDRSAREKGFDAALPKPLHRTAVLNCLAELYGLSLPGQENDEVAARFAGVSTGRSLRFLMAEDNHVNQLLLKAMLTGAGHEVDIVCNGQEAVDAMQNSSYDIVLMDVHMPVMNGLEATREIRRIQGKASQIPILAVTAAVLEKDRKKCFMAGMNDFVTKPIDKRDLFQKIEFWTGVEESSVAPMAEATNDGGVEEVSDEGVVALDGFLDSIEDPNAEQA